jgi:DNA-binding CsgD family transcriptional regulator
MNDHLPSITAAKISSLHSVSGLAAPEAGLVAETASRAGVVTPVTARRPLTDREKQVLRLVCEGLTNAEIAQRLGIAAETVKSELKRIFRKIEAKNRTQAAAMIVREGLV